MKEKVDFNYTKGRQMYHCDKDDTKICKNCIHWKYSNALPTIKSCELNMGSISCYMSCNNYRSRHMKERKYKWFIFHTDEDDFEQTESWRRVFTRYQRNDSATIYGMPNYDGAQLEIVMSK